MPTVDRRLWSVQANIYTHKAGASALDALRSIVISEQLLGTTEIVLVKHTGCGMLTFTEDVAHDLVDKNLGWVLNARFRVFRLFCLRPLA